MFLYRKYYYGFGETEGTAVRTGMLFLFYAEGVVFICKNTNVTNKEKEVSILEEISRSFRKHVERKMNRVLCSHFPN
jgi:uncharacterized ion transporter superfamily protein YfcC